MATLSKKVFSGFFWKFSERILAQLISFVVSIVIARILSPEDYGLVAMSMIFISLANVFVVNGFSTALIQRKDVDETSFSTLFYCSLLISIILYVILFFAAPFIAAFYNRTEITQLIRIFAIILPLSSYKSIQNAYVSKNLDFKKFFFSTLSGTIISAIVGIVMAVKGFGVWALVAQYFTNNIIDSIVLTFTIKWKPKLLFSFENAKPLLSYGSKILLVDLIGTLYNQLTSFIIGKKYTSADLAFYTKGRQIPDLINTNISSTITSVVFPAFSTSSDDYEEIKNMSKKAIKTSSYILMPFYFGLMAVSHNLINFLLTEKWLPCVIFVNIMCLNGIVGTLDIIDIQILKAIGKSETVLKLEFIKKPIYLVVIFIAMRFNITILALTVPVTSVIAIIANSHYVNKNIHYSLFEKIKDAGLSFIFSSLMFLAVYFMNYIPINTSVLLFIQIFTGIVIYLGLSILSKNETFFYVLSLLKRKKEE